MIMRVTAAPGRQVRLPDGRVLSDATEAVGGVEVERDIFIARRLADGDLLEVLEPSAPAGKEKAR